VPSVHNEQVKLLANAIDRASTACIAGGIITPFVGWRSWETSWLVASTDVWLLVAVSLHLLARRVLRGLQGE
jgi:hypothetical protein